MYIPYKYNDKVSSMIQPPLIKQSFFVNSCNVEINQMHDESLY